MSNHMRLSKRSSAWWGPPRKFDPRFEERKISWLELFYDLVYVIAISKITHHLGAHISLAGFLEYACFFILIFWGWLNGSLYHDLHGSSGLRTRLMTLWQVMIIAAVSITITQTSSKSFANTTIAFMVMQLFITYQWWSVGLYDKEHRKYNKPYTILYLVSFALLGLNLFLPQGSAKFILPLVVLFNYLPPFISQRVLRRSSLDLSLSSSMAERLGLFTIIVLGEVVLGVVNGISQVPQLNFIAWIKFALSLTIVFVLWWLFFTLTSNREVKKGFVRASLLEILFIPTLMSLGLMAASFTHFFETVADPVHAAISLYKLFGYSLATFLTGISFMMGMLEYPDVVKLIRKRVRGSLLATAFIFLIFVLLNIPMKPLYFLLTVIVILIAEVYYLNSLYYSLGIEEERKD